jgi:uncharacterized protein YdhG (YjbR/CyaY superfamily)
MSEDEVNTYLASLEEPKRTTLVALRRTILDIVPEAELCISYSVPAFRLRGKVIARDVADPGLPDRTWSHYFHCRDRCARNGR